MTDTKDELRAHGYITTATGMRFHYDKPGPFYIADIARSLSLTARFRGHTRFFYSVAQHSLMVERMVNFGTQASYLRKAALLHDAHEAYVGDVPTPLKWACPELQALEHSIALALRADAAPEVDETFYNAVKFYDDGVLHVEASCLLEFVPAWVKVPDWAARYAVEILQEDPISVERQFLERAYQLGLV